MEIRTIGIIGQGALGVMYGNHLTKKLGNVLCERDLERSVQL